MQYRDIYTKIDICNYSLKTYHQQKHGKPDPMKKNTVVAHDAYANKAVIRTVNHKNAPQCLENMNLDFSKYNLFKTY